MNKNEQKLIGSAEAARRIGVDRATLNRWAASGRLAVAVQMDGPSGARLFDPAEVARVKAEAASDV